MVGQGIDHLQHAVVDEKIVIAAFAADGEKGVLRARRDQVRVDALPGCGVEEFQGHDLDPAARRGRGRTTSSGRRVRDRLVGDQGDVEIVLQGLGQGAAVFFAAADQVQGMVVQGQRRLAPAGDDLAAQQQVVGGLGARGRRPVSAARATAARRSGRSPGGRPGTSRRRVRCYSCRAGGASSVRRLPVALAGFAARRSPRFNFSSRRRKRMKDAR